MKPEDIYPFDKDIERSLELIAKRLPAIKVKSKKTHLLEKNKAGKTQITKIEDNSIPTYDQVYGQQLMDREIFELNGKKVVSGKKYYISTGSLNVDHLPELKKAWINGGMTAVNAYADKVNGQINK